MVGAGSDDHGKHLQGHFTALSNFPYDLRSHALAMRSPVLQQV
jgi:hypothetical protein